MWREKKIRKRVISRKLKEMKVRESRRKSIKEGKKGSDNDDKIKYME